MLKLDAKNFIEQEILTRWPKWGAWDKKTGERIVTDQELESWIGILMEFDPQMAKQALEQLYRDSNSDSPNPKKFIVFARDIRAAKNNSKPITKKTIVESGYFVQLVAHDDWRKVGQFQPIYVEPLTVRQPDAVYEKAMNQFAARLKELYGGQWIGFAKTTHYEMSKRRFELHRLAKEQAVQAAIEEQQLQEKVNDAVQADLVKIANKLRPNDDTGVSHETNEYETGLNNSQSQAVEADVEDFEDDRPF
ncbi:MAG: hypothetical protein A2Y12_01215 [Planctomycetes bacterium GWF2_42_9]|nr:MAG: hypothetical protein A2Y12_01215 [Planctomycetes bacterium GWF2_42_9]